MMQSAETKNGSTWGRSLGAWIFALFGTTSLCVLVLAATGVNPDTGSSPATIVIAYLPSLAALAAAIFSGGAGVIALLKQIVRWRVALQWYALALFGPVALVLLANGIYLLMGNTLQWSTFFDMGALGASIGPLIAGSLGEEIGWRGFAQPLLQKRYSALTAAVIVGALWATWHLWPVLAPGGSVHFTSTEVLQTYVRLIATAVIYAWLYNSTRGSLLLVMVAHAGHNIAIDMMPAGNGVGLIIACLYLLAATVVVRMAGARTLSSARTA